MASSKLLNQLKENGRLPPIKLMIVPLDSSRSVLTLDDFTSYNFQNSIIVPVDTFSFTFVRPTLKDGKSFLDFVNEGDVAVLKCKTTAGDRTISTGIVDVIDIETTEGGELITVQGRDFLSQLEDQTCVNLNTNPLPFGTYNASQVLNYLAGNTRANHYAYPNYNPSKSAYFACEPGETKLSALLRYCEPLNILAWSAPDGTLNLGKPNMQENARTTLILDRVNRFSNVMGMKATRASTSIPNVILPLWSGQEYVQARIAKGTAFTNQAEGPKRLAQRAHIVLRAIVNSIPTGGDSVAQSDLQTLKEAAAANSTFMEAIAKREVARENMKELDVQVIVSGHYDDNLDPFVADTCHFINYSGAKVFEKMYCYSVVYEMSPDNGPRTRLNFCKLGSIVADNSFNPIKAGLPERARPV